MRANSPASALESVRRSSTIRSSRRASSRMMSKVCSEGGRTPSCMASVCPRMTLIGVRNSWAISAVIWRLKLIDCANLALMRLKDVASSPNSSRERTGTFCSRSPSATARVAVVISLIGRVSVRARKIPSRRETTIAPMAPNTNILLIFFKKRASAGFLPNPSGVAMSHPTTFSFT